MKARKTTDQSATPEKPYVKIERLSRFRYSAEVIDPTSWLTTDLYVTSFGLERARRKGEKGLRRYLRKKGYQQESWTLTLEES